MANGPTRCLVCQRRGDVRGLGRLVKIERGRLLPRDEPWLQLDQVCSGSRSWAIFRGPTVRTAPRGGGAAEQSGLLAGFVGVRQRSSLGNRAVVGALGALHSSG